MSELPGMWEESDLSGGWADTKDAEGDLLTAEEHRAVDMAGRLFSLVSRRVVGYGPTRQADLHEFAIHIHNIQHFIMAQAAARAFPTLYRLSGESLDKGTS